MMNIHHTEKIRRQDEYNTYNEIPTEVDKSFYIKDGKYIRISNYEMRKKIEEVRQNG